jgi:hypothetical protein
LQQSTCYYRDNGTTRAPDTRHEHASPNTEYPGPGGANHPGVMGLFQVQFDELLQYLRRLTNRRHGLIYSHSSWSQITSIATPWIVAIFTCPGFLLLRAVGQFLNWSRGKKLNRVHELARRIEARNKGAKLVS